ncbi:cyclin-dependent kinase inhibitor 3 [Canna indica]|uniref:Cyclin-dependent kinase inhibitor 3 n=1 Tax=Canna indica TaxID=4628 RepID=A0AAQ3KNF3_9LILI|nr:cyclin-dependent kinase inhibitor 3 [Canna indica]
MDDVGVTFDNGHGGGEGIRVVVVVRSQPAAAIVVVADGGVQADLFVVILYHRVLQNCNVILKPRIRRSAANSGDLRRSSPELGRTSRGSSNASREAAPMLYPSSEFCHVRDTDSFPHYNGERGVRPASSNHGDEAIDVESTVEMESRRRTTSSATPSTAELDEFFAAAENDLHRRFTER